MLFRETHFLKEKQSAVLVQKTTGFFLFYKFDFEVERSSFI